MTTIHIYLVLLHTFSICFNHKWYRYKVFLIKIFIVVSRCFQRDSFNRRLCCQMYSRRQYLLYFPSGHPFLQHPVETVSLLIILIKVNSVFFIIHFRPFLERLDIEIVLIIRAFRISSPSFAGNYSKLEKDRISD